MRHTVKTEIRQNNIENGAPFAFTYQINYCDAVYQMADFRLGPIFLFASLNTFWVIGTADSTGLQSGKSFWSMTEDLVLCGLLSYQFTRQQT